MKTAACWTFVSSEADGLKRSLGEADNGKLTQYLDAVRDVERRVQKAEQQIDREMPVFEQPVGIPGTFEEHAKLMYDLWALAFQTDLTRVGTFMTRKRGHRPLIS